MLKTVFLTDKFDKKYEAVMLLGGFDGLHAGHKKLLARALSYSLPVGIMTIVGGKDSKSLFTLAEREEIFRLAGIDFVFELPFAEIKTIPPSEFAALLKQTFNVKAFVCGDDFRFGHLAQGTPETLKRDTQVCVEVESLLKIDGEKVSSSKIKEFLERGEIEKANRLLGTTFFVTGEVFQDRQIGRTLGFPTANIDYPKEKFALKKGVYETRVCIDGKEYKAITNFGARPTFDNEKTLTETYIDGFQGDLYGKKLQIQFVRFLREITKFENVEALKQQLEQDIRSVREDD